MKRLVPGMLLLLITACTSYNEEELYPKQEVPCQIGTVSYLTDVKPILQRECYGCHATGLQSGNVTLDTYSGVKMAAEHHLLPAITHEPGHVPMPQGGNKLPACDIAKIRKWIEAGTLNN
jgi:mono/diheme cytochrome c family protein